MLFFRTAWASLSILRSYFIPQTFWLYPCRTVKSRGLLLRGLRRDLQPPGPVGEGEGAGWWLPGGTGRRNASDIGCSSGMVGRTIFSPLESGISRGYVGLSTAGMAVKMQRLPADGQKRRMKMPYTWFLRESASAVADSLAPSLHQCTGVVEPGLRAVRMGSGPVGDCLRPQNCIEILQRGEIPRNLKYKTKRGIRICICANG